MSCCNSDKSSCRFFNFIFCVLLLATGVFVIASLPGIKRYVRISTM